MLSQRLALNATDDITDLPAVVDDRGVRVYEDLDGRVTELVFEADQT